MASPTKIQISFRRCKSLFAWETPSCTTFLAIGLAFVALEADAGHAQADQGESNEDFPMRPGRFVLSRAHHSQCQLRQMVGRQNVSQPRITLGRNINGTHNPEQNDRGR